MITTFLSHSYKNFTRSSSYRKDVAIQIVLGIFVASLVGYSVAAGFALESIIVNALKQNDPITFLNGLLIYYFVAGFVTRYFIQSLPALDVQPYLHLPVPRNKLVHFLLGKSLIHVFNVFVFFLFTPFAFTAVAREYGFAQGCAWLLSLWFVSLINHFLIILTKKNLAQNIWAILSIIIICAGLAYIDYLGWVRSTLLSQQFFAAVLEGYTVVALLGLAVILLYLCTFLILKNKLYPEELTVQETLTLPSANWSFLQNFGLRGSWIAVELKLIFRNKRSREVFLLHVAFILFAFAFYSYIKNPVAFGTFLFIGVISSGFFIMNYGQFLFSWQGAHFDFTLIQPTSIRLFVESKYWLLVSTTVVWFFCSIPFIFLGWHFLFVNLVASLFNIGINIFIVMNMSMWGAKKIDLKHPGSLNLEGMGAAQWLLGIPLFASPYIFYLPFSLAGYPLSGLACVGVAGVIGIVFRGKLIDLTSRRLHNMRHAMASNFRKD